VAGDDEQPTWGSRRETADHLINACERKPAALPSAAVKWCEGKPSLVYLHLWCCVPGARLPFCDTIKVSTVPSMPQ
jgi:hypothetical protein